jgi:hypothetical protein
MTVAGITPHEFVVILVGLVVAKMVGWAWRRLGFGFGKYWRARAQAALYYTQAPVSVLVAYAAKQIYWALFYATIIVVESIALSSVHPGDKFTRVVNLLTIGVAIFGMAESFMRLCEIENTAADAWKATWSDNPHA